MTMSDQDMKAMGVPRYTGIPTFMRTPYRETASGLDIAMVGRALRWRCHQPPRRQTWPARGA